MTLVEFSDEEMVTFRENMPSKQRVLEKLVALFLKKN